MQDFLEQSQADKSRNIDTIVPQYVSKRNELGVDGYNLIAALVLAEGFPIPSQLQLFFKSFCTQRGIESDEIPFVVKLPKQDDADILPLAIATVVMVFEEFGYSLNDTEGFSVKSPKGLIVTKLGSGAPRMLVEHYDGDTNTVYVANRLSYDDDIRRQLESRYNIPANVSEDYLMTYLIAHSTVHHIQKLQNRREKNPKGYKDNPEKFVKEALELQTEKEAHNVGIKIADDIWQKTVGRTKESGVHK